MSTSAQSSHRSTRILAARYLSPFRQGDLDGLCGLYSVINAIALARWPHLPVRRVEAAQLFECGLWHLNRTADLVETVADGMEWGTLRTIAELLCVQASIGQVKLEIERLPYSVPAMKRRSVLGQKIANQHPVIINIETRGHLSVVVGISPTRLYLFDSGSGHWIPRFATNLTNAISISAMIRI